MRFMNRTIPGSVFKLARDRMLLEASFTPADIREYLLKAAGTELARLSSIPVNQQIVANRVTRACIDELRTSKDIVPLKRGTWARVL